MENASKALLMAGGVLIGVLILALMVTLFVSSNNMFDSYDATKKAEVIQQFNVNFMQYLNKDLTIHQVVTICNFANANGVKIISGGKTSANIRAIVDAYTTNENSIQKYELTIENYSDNGYIDQISFSEK